MFLAAILVLVIYIGIIVAATVIASSKGRSAIGWCILIYGQNINNNHLIVVLVVL